MKRPIGPIRTDGAYRGPSIARVYRHRTAKFSAPLQPPNEELLRVDLLYATKSLDAARAAIANNKVTKEEGKLIYAAAQSRYAAALRRFSRLVLDGEVPADVVSPVVEENLPLAESAKSFLEEYGLAEYDML